MGREHPQMTSERKDEERGGLASMAFELKLDHWLDHDEFIQK
jgi:hypothetical protein